MKLHLIGIFAVSEKKIHPLIPHDAGNGSTGFAVALVEWHIIVRSVALVVILISHCTCDIGFGLCAGPEALERFRVNACACLQLKICHGGAHVMCTDAMTEKLLLLSDRCIILTAFRPEGSSVPTLMVAARAQEERGQFRVCICLSAVAATDFAAEICQL